MEDFWKLLKTVKSPNGANLLRIDCDILLTPIQMALLAREADANNADPEIMSWLQRREQQSGTKMLTRPKRFIRSIVNDSMSLHTLGNPPTGKALLIAFTGLGCMFMMPKSIFLQQFDATKWDIVYIDAEAQKLRTTYDLTETDRSTRVHYFENGGLQGSIDETANTLRQTYDLAAYDHIVCAGVSSGAAFSLVLAVELGATLGVGVGARLDPQEPIDAAKLHASKAKTSLYSVYSQDYERDKISAFDLQQRLNAQPVPIAGVKRHNPFKKVIRSGKIRRLLPGLFDPYGDPMESARSYARAIKLADDFDG